MGYATTVLRIVTGATMAGHGLQKLTNSMGGKGPAAAGDNFEKIGFTPGKHFAVATGVAETTGGTLMALGLATPVACSMVTGVMASAIAKVHYQNGFWVSNKGFEYNLNIMAATFAVAGAGGGALALDGLRGKKHRGFGWAVAQLAVGVAAAYATLEIAERQAATSAAPQQSLAAQRDDEALDLSTGSGHGHGHDGAEHDHSGQPESWDHESQSAGSMS